jgi:hypothetical protein
MTVGSKVTLTDPLRMVCAYPEKYQTGTVTSIGSWGIVDVQWNGIDRPIGMRADEIREVES